MSENSNGRNWWHTLPGMITAVAGLFTAISGLVLALHQAGIVESKAQYVMEPKAATLTPNAGRPARVEPRPASAHRNLEAFVQTYLGFLNSCNPTELLGLYADVVDYLDAGKVPLDFIRQEREQFCERWEEFRYEQAGGVSIVDAGAEDEKQLTFGLQFFARRPARRKEVSGTAIKTLIVRPIDGEFRIINEKMGVTKHKHLSHKTSTMGSGS